MSGQRAVNFDTSVLLNYVYTKLPGDIEDDSHSQRLLEDSSLHRVIGGKAEGEFNRCCERREEIYDDLLDWLEDNPDVDIFEYDVATRDIHTSRNDTDHIRFDVQCGWADDDRREQLSDFRRLSQGIETLRRDIVRNFLDKIYSQFAHEDLESELRGLGLEHDRHIVIDAVEIHREDSIDLLVGADSDLTRNVDEINNRISTVESSSLELRIKDASEV